MRDRHSARLWLSGALALASLALASSALAHTLTDAAFQSSPGAADWCVEARAAINLNGGSDGATGATTRSYHDGCLGFKNKDPLKIRVQNNLLKRIDGVYEQCDVNNYIYNSTETYFATHPIYYGSAWCGGGAYKTGTHSGVQDGGEWKTTSVRSPSHAW